MDRQSNMADSAGSEFPGEASRRRKIRNIIAGAFIVAFPIALIAAAAVVFTMWSRPVPPELGKDERTLELDRVMQTFYIDPQAEKAARFLRLLAKHDAREILKSQPCLGVFLGEIFSRYPEHLAQWTAARGNSSYQATLKFALLYAGTPEAKTAYCKLAGATPDGLPPAPADVGRTKAENCTPEIIEACWGGLFASGNKKYLGPVAEAALYPVQAGEGAPVRRPGVDPATRHTALMSLLDRCDRHPAVKEFFREKLRNAYPQIQYALAKEISEDRQKELLGRVLLSDEEKDKNDSAEQKRERQDPVREGTRLKPEFFAALHRVPLLSYQTDFLRRAHKLFEREVKEKFPDLPEKEIDRITWNHILLKDLALPRKPPRSKASFLEFYAIRIYMKNNPVNTRQKRMFLDSGLRLARQYRDDLTVARMVFRELEPTEVISYLTPGMLQRGKLHPYLLLMLQGEYARLTAWKHRGGGYADTVSTHGRQSFRENLKKARVFFEEAARKYPSAPEAPAKMLNVIGSGCGEEAEMVVWLKRALAAQADYADAMNAFTWFSRPRWGGSAPQLLADAKAFFLEREKNPRLAQNGIYLLQAFLSEIPFVDCVRYFRGDRNYGELKELFEELTKIAPLDPAQKLFFGTAALFADDRDTADDIVKSLTGEDKIFARKLRYGSIPQIYWADFPALHRTLSRTGLRGELLQTLYRKRPADAAAWLKTKIPAAAADDRQVLIDLYAALKGRIDWMSFRGRMPMFIRLCAESEEHMELIKEMIVLGTDVNICSPTGARRPLFYAMRDKKSGELLDLLLEAGADPDAMWGEHTPLDYSCRYRFPAARIRRLLQAGADPNKKYRKSFTPLHASVGNPEGTKLLVEFGAKLNEVTEFGHTPLDLAEKTGSVEVARFLRSKGAKRASEL